MTGLGLATWLEVEGSASSFVLSPPTKQFKREHARRYLKSTDNHPREDDYYLPNRTYLFLGVCSIYPGKTRYHASETS